MLERPVAAKLRVGHASYTVRYRLISQASVSQTSMKMEELISARLVRLALGLCEMSFEILEQKPTLPSAVLDQPMSCLLYTSDAADE